jgi:thiol-disulfide isomerase/thioredoxin
MNPEIFSRILLAVTIVGVGLIIYSLLNRRTLARNNGRISQFPSYKQGVPAILYFTTPTCVPCKTVQRPALKKLKDSLGERIQIIEVDASANTTLASTWGVLSVPTTYIFDENGRTRYVNHGVTLADQLFQQLEIEDYSI